MTATDSSGLSTSETLAAAILPAAPTVAHQTASQAWTAGQTMNFLLPANTFADPQHAAMTYMAFQTSGTDFSSWLQFNPATGDLMGSVPAAAAGTVGLQIYATDTFGLSTSESFGLTIAASGSHAAAATTPRATEMIPLPQ